MVVLLTHLALAAAVTVSLTANEKIQPPEVSAIVAGQWTPVAMADPTGNQVEWNGSCPTWPTAVTATFYDLAGNRGTASWRLLAADDVPDIRLGVSPALPSTGAFDLFESVSSEFVPFSDIEVAVPVETTGNSGPPFFSPGGPFQPTVTVERAAVDNATVIVSRGNSLPGWSALDYSILVPTDGAGITARGYAKYSSFSFLQPRILTGRMFDTAGPGNPMTRTWLGKSLEVPPLKTLSSVPGELQWELYVNAVDYHRTVHGMVLGVDPVFGARHVAGSSTPSVSHEGWTFAINPDGVLAISSAKVSGDGPFLLGVLARNAAAPDDTDTARYLFTKGLLAVCPPRPPVLTVPAEPTPFVPPTHDKSETLDGLAPGPIPPPAAPIPGQVPEDYRIPIQAGSHWGYHLYASDAATSPAPLEVVNLVTDPDLPPAAHPEYLALMAAPAIPSIATGNALKASFQPTGGLPTPGVRLMSWAFNGLQPGDVLTFAVNIATDITDATHSPDVDMALASGWGTGSMGFSLSGVAYPENPSARGTLLEQYQPTLIPWAHEGWQTLSVNYTPPLTSRYMDVDRDGDCDENDRSVLRYHPVIGSYPKEGWEDELNVAKANLAIRARPTMSKAFHVWLDNLRVYRSAYEIDLALSRAEYTEPAAIETYSLPSWIVERPEGSIDGSFSSFVNTANIRADLTRIGWAVGNGAGPAETALREPFGSLPANASYVPTHDSSYIVISGVDRTKGGSKGKCLQIALVSPRGLGVYEGDFTSVRARVVSAAVAVPGSGVYCFEAHISKGRRTDMLQTARSPAVLVALNEIAPNPLVHAAGAFFNDGGLPESVFAPQDAWLRVVGTAYIPGAQLVRGIIQVWDPFDQPVANFGVPILIDECRIYQADDPACFFDADLFDEL